MESRPGKVHSLKQKSGRKASESWKPNGKGPNFTRQKRVFGAVQKPSVLLEKSSKPTQSPPATLPNPEAKNTSEKNATRLKKKCVCFQEKDSDKGGNSLQKGRVSEPQTPVKSSSVATKPRLSVTPYHSAEKSSSLDCIRIYVFFGKYLHLAKMGMTDDFEAFLQVLRGFDTDITLEVNDIKRFVASSSRRTTLHFAELKSRRYRLPLMIGIGLLILQQLSGINGVIFYSYNIFAILVTHCLQSFFFKCKSFLIVTNAATVGVGIIQVIATAIATWLMDRTGRRVLLIVSSSGMVLSLLLVSVSFFLKILPVKVKSLSGSVATLANWLFSWIITMTAP